MTGGPVTFLMIVNDKAWFWSHRLPLARAILEKGWTLHLATNDAAQDPAIAALGIKGHDLPRHTGSFSPLAQIRLLFSLCKAIRAARPDILHAITIRHAFLTGIAAWLVGYKGGRVYTLAGLGRLFTEEDPKILLLRKIISPLFRKVFDGPKSFIIFQNSDNAQVMLDAGTVDADKIVVIRGSGVDTAHFPYMPETVTATPVILFSSRLLKSKGVGEFVHAARILKSKGIPGRFVIAGGTYEGNKDSITKGQIKSWHKEGAIEWLGQVTDMPRLIGKCHLVVLPSYYGEGVPKILLEAAATGRAIVTTDMPGCRETVEDEITGFLVQPKDAWALAAAIEKLLNDPARRQAMGLAARRRIEDHFTVEQVNAATLCVYDNLLRSG